MNLLLDSTNDLTHFIFHKLLFLKALDTKCLDTGHELHPLSGVCEELHNQDCLVSLVCCAPLIVSTVCVILTVVLFHQ